MTLEDRIVNSLEILNPVRPWMTAKGLRIRIGKLEHNKIQEQEIEESLATLENLNDPKIRRSKLPSKKSLMLLWGHVNNVGVKEVPPTEKVNLADSFFEDDIAELGEDSPICFLSHSHKDFINIMSIGKDIAGYGVYPWTAEVDIQIGNPINRNILDALGNSDYFMVYITKNSIDSIWTKKEFMMALSLPLKVIVLLESSDSQIVLAKLFNNRNLPTDTDTVSVGERTKSIHEFPIILKDAIVDNRIELIINGENDGSFEPLRNLFGKGEFTTMEQVFENTKPIET